MLVLVAASLLSATTAAAMPAHAPVFRILSIAATGHGHHDDGCPASNCEQMCVLADCSTLSASGPVGGLVTFDPEPLPAIVPDAERVLPNSAFLPEAPPPRA